MIALVLAGGLGTRLRPLTLTRPKHLLPIANRPHIEHVFDLLLRYDVTHAVMLTSYLSTAFTPVFEKARARGLRIDAVLEEEPLGTAGAIRNAQGVVGDEPFLAFNGDVLTDIDLSSVVARHVEDRAEATLVLTPVEDPSAFGVVPTDETGRVLGFIEKPPRDEAPTNFINAGIYVFEPSVLDRIPEGRAWSAEHQLFPSLVEEKARLFAHGTDAYWMDIGTPEKFLQANLDVLDGRYESSTTAGPSGILLDEGARVAPSATVRRAILGRDAIVSAGAHVEESVLLPGVSIGPGARVIRSVLGEGVDVPPGSLVSAQVIGDGESA